MKLDIGLDLKKAVGKIQREVTSVKFWSIIGLVASFKSGAINADQFIAGLVGLVGIRELGDVIPLIGGVVKDYLGKKK